MPPRHGSPISRRELARTVKLARRHVFERAGSERYSRPALYGLDEALAEWLPPGPGFFVEAGANDGYTQSNTYRLERFQGWTGLLVEPTPHLARVCRKVRPRSEVVECALVAPQDAGSLVDLDYADLMSVVRGARGGEAADRAWAASGRELLGLKAATYRVPGRTLGEVLDSSSLPRVDFLSLDVEGFEVQALSGLGRWEPQWILVEANDEPSLIESLGDRYELVDRPTPRDLLFRRR